MIKKIMETGLLTCDKVGRPFQSSLHIFEQHVLMKAILGNPSLTLKELLSVILRSTGSEYDASTIWRTETIWIYEEKV